MDEPTHQFRLALTRPEATYRLTDSALVWSERGVEGRLPFSDIRQVRIYRTPGVGFGRATFAPGFQRCVVRPRSGRAQVLSSNHYAGLANIEDRSASFQPFVDALIRRVAAANPGTAFISGMPAALWIASIAMREGLLGDTIRTVVEQTESQLRVQTSCARIRG